MKMEIVLMRAGIPHTDGNTYSREVLETMAKEDPTNLRVNKEGWLMKTVTDKDTDTLTKLFAGTQAEAYTGDEGLEKFQQILSVREEKAQEELAKNNRKWTTITLDEAAEGSPEEDEDRCKYCDSKDGDHAMYCEWVKSLDKSRLTKETL